MFLRTILQFLRSRRGPRLHLHEVAHTMLRVLPPDLDTLNHMNNGVYFSIMDLGRIDLLIRSGAWDRMSKMGFYPVISNATISYRKSLQSWQRFVLESRVIGYDDKAVFLEQRFVVDGEIYARGFVRARFLKKAGGTVGVAELAEALGVDVSETTLPEWLTQWSDDVALPPTRASAPSVWED